MLTHLASLPPGQFSMHGRTENSHIICCGGRGERIRNFYSWVAEHSPPPAAITTTTTGWLVRNTDLSAKTLYVTVKSFLGLFLTFQFPGWLTGRQTDISSLFTLVSPAYKICLLTTDSAH